jgi:ABC-type phosphate transport system substrate-binding protein
LIALVCVLAFAAPFANAQFSLKFGGATAAESLMSNVAFDFLSVNSDAAVVSYTMSSDALGRSNIVNNTKTYDVGVAGTPFTTDDVAGAASKAGTLLSFPFMSSAIVVIYSMPGIPNTIPLMLNKQLLLDIFSGTIVKWNHPDITVSFFPFVRVAPKH